MQILKLSKSLKFHKCNQKKLAKNLISAHRYMKSSWMESIAGTSNTASQVLNKKLTMSDQEKESTIVVLIAIYACWCVVLKKISNFDACMPSSSSSIRKNSSSPNLLKIKINLSL